MTFPEEPVSLQNALQRQQATIQELERRLALSSVELAESESRVASLRKRNTQLQGIAKARAQGTAVSPISASTPTRRANSAGRQIQDLRSASPQRDLSLPPPDTADRSARDEVEDDEIDSTIRRYLAERPDVNVEFEKISTMRKGWYVKPIGKKVFLKQAGKDKLVVRVGGGHVSFLKFLADFVQV